MDFYLKKLEEKSISIIREARMKFKNVGVLWSMGKDSTTLLFLCKKAFFGKIPFPAIHLDNGHDFPETYQFRDFLTKEWKINLLVVETEYKKDPISGTIDGLSKVDAMKKMLKQYNFEALMVPIRRDSHEARAKEFYFSPRDKEFQWDFGNKPPEQFNSLADFKGASHVRVHPSLDWTEIDVWRYIKENNIPVNPLYFAKNGKRYRSIGYPDATLPVESNAKNVDEIIEELKTTKISERKGRIKDGENEEVMERLRGLGYM